ncbi:Mor transcription activator family protein [Enterocloster aldenensis]|uniref:Mor transcription activator family protein n=1 Tax=Enterocloster aldenensis TaxID=358742 RepID=A0AAW5BPD8_9FIRM|nr:Mor transcription activator family protein [Enterocloster aldenensis]
MKKELMDELAAETTLDDISESYKPLVEMIGLGNVLKLSQYFMGDKMYIPKVERILSPARNRRIRREYNGYNTKELAQDYDLTTNQILQIVRDMDPQQISLFDIIDGEDT